MLCNKDCVRLSIYIHHYHHHHHHHQILLLLVQHRASMKNVQTLRSPAIPWSRSMIFLWFLIHPLLSFATFSLACLFFYIPENSNPVIQGGWNTTGTDLCVNKPQCAAAVRPWESEATTSTLPPARVRNCSVLSGSC